MPKFSLRISSLQKMAAVITRICVCASCDDRSMNDRMFMISADFYLDQVSIFRVFLVGNVTWFSFGLVPEHSYFGLLCWHAKSDVQTVNCFGTDVRPVDFGANYIIHPEILAAYSNLCSGFHLTETVMTAALLFVT